MKVVLDERNQAGETLSRSEYNFISASSAIEYAQAVLNIPDTKTVRVVIFEDNRPEFSDIPNVHDPRYFIPKVDMTKTNIIGQSWN